MTLPNFLIIGAPKAGTTSLYTYLQQHPQIYMSPIKETRFFTADGKPLRHAGPYEKSLIQAVWRHSDYEALFAGVRNELAIGEATPSYLRLPGVAERIAALLPDVKLVAILRHPAERAYSHYMMLVRDGREPLGFEDALRMEPERIAANWYYGRYRTAGYYARQLRPYYQLFPQNNICLFLYDDLVRSPHEMLRDLFRFLGVDESVPIDVSRRRNVSGIIKNPILRAVWTKTNGPRALIRPLVPRTVRRVVAEFFESRAKLQPPMNDATRQELIDGFRDDILELQGMIGRDLSAWLR